MSEFEILILKARMRDLLHLLQWKDFDSRDAAEIKSAMDDIRRMLDKSQQIGEIKLTQKHLDALSLSQIGSCTCLTKTPDTKFHSDTCRYRLLHEVSQALISTKIVDVQAGT
jgi:hypothetical protein